MRFRPKSLQEQQDNPLGVKRGANYAREQNERKLVDRYQNLKEEDFKINKLVVQKLVPGLKITNVQAKEFNGVENTNLLADKINGFLTDQPA